MTNKSKHIAIFGVGDDGKARACRFDAGREPSLREGAGRLNFRVGVPKGEQATSIAAKLPEGKIEADGFAVPPAIDDILFYKLAKSMVFDKAWINAGKISGSTEASDSDTLKAADALWSAIKEGSTVLVFDFADPEAFGWSAAIVTSISKDGQKPTLRWRDWPGLSKPFIVDRSAVALLPPNNTMFLRS